MKEFEEQGGVAFLIIEYTHKNLFIYMPFKDIYYFWKRMKDGGRKSFQFKEVDLSYQIKLKGGLLHYLEALQKDLETREE